MKKLLLFGVLALLVSCSQSDDLPENINPTAKIHTVTFKVKSEFFDVESVPMGTKAKTRVEITEDEQYSEFYGTHILQAIIYKESGEVYSNRITGASSFEELVAGDNGLLTYDLPEGNYHVAIVAALCPNRDYPHTYYIKPENYYTDYYQPNAGVASAKVGNQNSYYDTFDITVDGNAAPITVTLDPMWSLLSLELTGLQDIAIPPGAGTVLIYVDPYYMGFSLKDKISKKPTNESYLYSTIVQMSIDKFLALEKLNASNIITAGESPVNIMLAFTDGGGAKILQERSLLEYTYDENGRRYSVKGALAKENVGDVDFRMEMGSFNDEPIEVPFGPKNK